jgi:sentrin-specific protease 7
LLQLLVFLVDLSYFLFSILCLPVGAVSNPVSMDLPGIDAEERLGSNDFLHWNGVAGLKEPFVAIHCKSVRIGSYRFTPVGQVLFSSKGIMLQAPVFHNHNESSEKSAVWVNVAIPTQQIMKVDAHFSKQLKVIFLNCLPSLCRQLSSKLGLPKSGPYWDSASEDESQKLLTLFPGNLNYATKNAIKKVFVPRGVYHVINHAETNRLLVFSAPPEVRDALNRLHAGTSVPAETSVSSIDSQDVIGDKEDAIKGEPNIKECKHICFQCCFLLLLIYPDLSYYFYFQFFVYP